MKNEAARTTSSFPLLLSPGKTRTAGKVEKGKLIAGGLTWRRGNPLPAVRGGEGEIHCRGFEAEKGKPIAGRSRCKRGRPLPAVRGGDLEAHCQR